MSLVRKSNSTHLGICKTFCWVHLEELQDLPKKYLKNGHINYMMMNKQQVQQFALQRDTKHYHNFASSGIRKDTGKEN